MRLLRRLRASLSHRDADRRNRVIEIGQPEHSVVTTCAYCGVGCSLQGRDARQRSRAHGAVEGRQGQSRPFLRQGPLRLGLRDAQRPHPQADDPREYQRSVARSVVGRGDRPRRVRVQAHPGAVRPRLASAASPPRAARIEETYLVQKLVRAGFGNNNVDTCARVCHSPTGYGLSQTFGTSAGTQDFDSCRACRRRPWSIGANPTDGASGVRLAHEEAAARRARS